MKQPCNTCPFRSDAPFHGLSEERALEIASALMADSAFHCHNTVDYSRSSSGRVTKDSTLCTGAAIFLEQVRPGGLRANLAFRLAVMTKKLHPDELSDQVPVYESIDDFLEGAT